MIAQGYRLVFAPDAVAFEPVARSAELEFGRKVRVMTRGLRGVLLRRELLHPRSHGFYAVQLFGHKVFAPPDGFPARRRRWDSPLLWRQGRIYRVATISRPGCTGSAPRESSPRRPLGRRKALVLPAFFCFVNVAALKATWNVLRGRRIDRWEPRREGPADPTPPVITETLRLPGGMEG